MLKVGQKVVCIDGEEWWDKITGLQVNGPKTDEIIKINFFDNEGGLGFNTYDKSVGFVPHYFRPLIDDTVERIMEQVRTKEHSDHMIDAVMYASKHYKSL